MLFLRILKKYRDTWLILPNDYYDSEYIFYWVNDDESCEAMWNGTVLNDLVNGYDILLIADEEQHDYHLVPTHLLNKITEDECRDRIFRAINFALSASRMKRELVLQEDVIGGGPRYIIRSKA
ncbi:hypothetical protein P8452_26230 [Trifolium repens]|nr:hypothetical protein P8452_26230 [Trifolium repens]